MSRGSMSPSRVSRESTEESRSRREKVVVTTGHLRDLSAVSRSLATPQMDLADQSSVSRSFAVLCCTSEDEAEEEQTTLRNMSSVSHNLANVGALPQCNQRHARCTAPVAVVEPEALPVADSLTEDLKPKSRTASFLAAAKRRKCVPNAALVDDDETTKKKKLEQRRTKNREAAERMRRRRREESDVLQKTVEDLAAQVASLSARLAASEQTNQHLRTQLKAQSDIPTKDSDIAPIHLQEAQQLPQHYFNTKLLDENPITSSPSLS